jgi:hypothetical protein
MRALLRRVVLVLPFMVVAECAVTAYHGCTDKPWDAYPMATMPDRTCSTGGIGGYSVWEWDCSGGKHVVVALFHGDMFGFSTPKQDDAACGAPTELEQHVRLTDREKMCGSDRAQPWQPAE